MSKTFLFAALALLLAAPIAVSAADAVKVDPKLPVYQPVKGVSGTLKSVGSDTMNNLMTLWLEGFQQVYPNIRFEMEGKGSATAPPALISGTASLGPMSRAWKEKEISDFEQKFGYKPTAIPTSVDMLAIYVNKDNPIKGLTLQQADAIFSENRKGGAKSNIRTWGDLGLTGEWKDQPISLYGRNSASGTYGFFKEHVLKGGDYKNAVKEQPGSSAVVQGVAKDKYAIGYSGIGYKTAEVRAVPLAYDGVKYVPAESAHAYDGTYPLSRFLWLSLNVKPGTPLDPLRREFVKFVFSQQGQAGVIKDGYYPLTFKVADKALKDAGVAASSGAAATTKPASSSTKATGPSATKKSPITGANAPAATK